VLPLHPMTARGDYMAALEWLDLAQWSRHIWTAKQTVPQLVKGVDVHSGYL
jgi:hypothetical protein